MPGAGALTLAPHDAVARQAWQQRGGSNEAEQDSATARSGAVAAPAGQNAAPPERAALAPQNPQALHRDAYALNNPSRYVDPTGHLVVPPDCPPVCAPEEIDISAWPALAQEAAALGCLLLGCHVDEQRARIVPPSPVEQMADSVLGMGMPAGVIGDRLKKAGIAFSDHALHRLVTRQGRGVTEEAVLRSYNRGRLFYNPRTKNYMRYDPQTGVITVVDRPSNGTIITVFEGKPAKHLRPVRWRPGR